MPYKIDQTVSIVTGFADIASTHIANLRHDLPDSGFVQAVVLRSKLKQELGHVAQFTQLRLDAQHRILLPATNKL